MQQNFEESDDEEDEIEEAAEMVYERLQGTFFDTIVFDDNSTLTNMGRR